MTGQVIAIGVDVVEVERFRRWLGGIGESAWSEVFTATELQTAGKLRDPAASLAARFAAKEAVFKVLEVLDPFAFDWRQIEIRRNEHGAPCVHLHAEAADAAAERGIDAIAVSLSHSRNIAIAQAAALPQHSTPP